MNRRAVVIKTVGDNEIAGAIVESVTRRVIPLDNDELTTVKAELARLKEEKRRQDARDGVRAAADEKRWAAIAANMAEEYSIETPSRVGSAILGAWGLLWLSIMEWVEYFQKWNREA